MTPGVASRIAVVLVTVLAVAGTAAAADDPQAPGSGRAQAAGAQQGPLVLEPVENGLFLMPEMRLTRVDKYSATFFGGSGGWLFHDVFVLGAGGYAMVAGKDNVGMKYGGLIAGFEFPAGDNLKIGLRALVGYGDARLTERLPIECPYPSASLVPCYGPVPVRVNYAVFEPQASLLARLGSQWTFDLTGGYRMIGDAGGLEGRLQSGFGSVGFRFGSF